MIPRAEDRGPAGPEDAGLLDTDLFDGVAEPLPVIEADRDDGGDVGIEQVDGIEPSAHADFEHRHFDALACKHDERRERVPLEE